MVCLASDSCLVQAQKGVCCSSCLLLFWAGVACPGHLRWISGLGELASMDVLCPESAVRLPSEALECSEKQILLTVKGAYVWIGRHLELIGLKIELLATPESFFGEICTFALQQLQQQASIMRQRWQLLLQDHILFLLSLQVINFVGFGCSLL